MRYICTKRLLYLSLDFQILPALVIDLDVVHVILVLQAFQMQKLCGQRHFHPDFKGRPGSPSKEPLTQQWVKFWEPSQRFSGASRKLIFLEHGMSAWGSCRL